MDEGVRSTGPSGVLVKTRNSSGCLIVRKKGDGLGGVGSSSSRLPSLDSKKEKKRPRLILSDSGSSDEILLPQRGRFGPETIRVCNGLNSFEKGGVEERRDIRRNNRLQYGSRDDDALVDGMDEDGLQRSMGSLDVFEFNEYDDDGEKRRKKHFNGSGDRRFHGSSSMNGAVEREFDSGSSRYVVDKRKSLYLDQTSSFDRERSSRKINFDTNNNGAHLPVSLLREKSRGKSDEAIRVQGKNGVLKVMVNKKKNAHRPLDIYDHKLNESRKSLRTEDSLKRKVLVASSVYPETKPLERQDPFPKPEKDHTDFQTSAPTKNGKGCSLDSGNSSVSLKPRKKVSEAPKSTKRASSEVEITPCEETPPSTMKEGKVKRGSGTEKQKLRERIREMLLSSGWKIDYRPRRNRDYLDAVYVNPAGTAYWSIIKAYDALQKQSNEEGAEAKPSVDGSFMPISDDILSQLTRKTRKKMEKERKNKRRDDSDSENAKEASALRSGGTKYDMDSMDSDSNEEKLSSYIKQGGKSIKNKVNENGFPSVNSKGQSSNKHLRDTAVKLSSGSNSRILHGRKGKKLGLMVRGSSRGLDSENDGFVPYTGKRTLLSWLIDSGTVQLSQKVRYMNRRQTRVMLEGWITRDGIHCGCCSKILTVSKFEIHAGSKLRQPFQNIFLESGVSLLQCQIDAWNRQEESKRLGFHTVEIDGDDPNDDTCGICADGGDLICCDGCPSTFHQSCLEIQIPPGDWHCPNCTCKFCGVASVDVSHGDNMIVPVISSCMLCEKKFHESCIQDMDALTCSNGSVSSFCGKNCGELFENLQKYLGARHELDAGFSWSLIRRTNEDSDASLRGLSQRIECNSKLAVALTVMDECFLPIVDRRSGINLIHNVLYNCGSNFYRLNYSGFYTAILERGDEIISAATIRFHGTKLAEMPFIGTRHIYRRQGMCRRLFCAIESALRLLKVEMLIIPAIAELMHTWTVIFGFSPLEQSLKQEMRLINMLVFPGTDMLQKLLTEEKVVEENVSTGSGAKKMRSKSEEFTSPKMDTEALSEHEPQSHNDTEQNHFEVTTNEVAVTGTSVADNSLDHEVRTSLLPVETINPDSHSDDKLAKCASDKKCSSPSDSDARYDSPAETGTHLESVSASQNYTSVVNSSFHHEVRSTLLPVETITSDFHSENKLAKCASDREYSSPSDTDARYDSPPAETGTHPESISVSQNDTSVANSSLDHKVRILLLPVETINSDSPSENKLAKCSSALAADARYDSSPAGNSPQRDHCIEDHKLSTPQCMEVGTSVMSSSSDGFHESKVTVSEKGIIGSNSHVGHNLAGPGSVKKSFPSVIDNGTDEVENTPVMDSPEDDKSSNKTSDHDIRDFQPVMDYPEDDKSSNKISGHDIREVDADVNFLKTAHLVETFAESAVKENSVVSASGLNGTSGRPFEIISDLNNSMASGKESKLSAASESTFDAMHCSESSPHSSGAKSRGDSQEVRVESGSI